MAVALPAFAERLDFFQHKSWFSQGDVLLSSRLGRDLRSELPQARLHQRHKVTPEGGLLPRLGIIHADRLRPIVVGIPDRPSEVKCARHSLLDNDGCPGAFFDEIVLHFGVGLEFGWGGVEVFGIGLRQLRIR